MIYGDSLKSRMIRGGIWVFGLQILNQLVSFGKVIALAKILDPRDFGIFGYSFLALSTLDAFTRTGFREALIQRKEYASDHLNVAWTIEVLRGFFILVLLQVLADPVAVFFGFPEIAGGIRVIGFCLLFQSLSNISLVIQEKSLSFRNVFITDVAGTLSDFIFTILFAIILKNWWAMILGFMSGSLVRCFCSYFTTGFRPVFSLDRNVIAELMPFSKWVFKTSIMGFFIGQGDAVIVGRLLGATGLGFYQMANTISSFPMTQLSNIISKVAFPAFSEIQDDALKLQMLFSQMMKVVTIVVLPIVVAIIVFIPDFINLFLDAKWISISPLVQLMIFAGFLRPLASIQDTLLAAMGKPFVGTKVQFVRMLVLVTLLYPMTKFFGAIGAAGSGFIGTLVTFMLFTFATVKIFRISIKSVVLSSFKHLAVGMLLLSISFMLKKIISPMSAPLFFIVMAIFLSLYIFFIFITERNLFSSITRIVTPSGRKVSCEG